MQVAVDKFGRVIIPKLIRQHLGISSGSHLSIEEQDQQLVLKVLDSQQLLKNREGVLVFTGKILAQENDPLQSIREERLSNLL